MVIIEGLGSLPSDAAGVVVVMINNYMDLVFIHFHTYTFMLPLNTLVLV
ncbi:hypothetical protein HanXRQr2_Chr05g0219071 [Helianthus annuus]|uniref:Uncharacterized protein n=1 Tax=Helianthus annuus TaxID=4232 RepID=A0A9K3NP35_HELAN|nr:hypothetical protein HanXRQr2_Chr05g0219071 [Helianthus annuus]